jgi:hypothetical protein
MASAIRSKIGSADMTGEQLDFGRTDWLSDTAQQLLEEAATNPEIGPEKTLAIVLHHGLGLSLELVSVLTGVTKNVAAKRVISGTRKLRGVAPHVPAVAATSRALTLAEFCDQWIPSCADASRYTRILYATVANKLCAMSGNRPVSDFSLADAERFMQSLAAAGLSRSTMGSQRSAAKMLFSGAVRAGLISENVFQRVGLPDSPLRAAAGDDASPGDGDPVAAMHGSASAA